jgi:hypothetical protein
MRGWWTCGNCKDDVKCYQEDWEDSNHDEKEHVSQISNDWGILELITTEDTVKVFIPKNPQPIAEMKRSDYDFFMNPMKELEDHFPLPRHLGMMICDKCGYQDGDEKEESELLQSCNRTYHPTAPEVVCRPISVDVTGHEFGWTLCTRCNNKADRLLQQCFRSPEQIAEALGCHVATLQNMPMKRSSGAMESGWAVKGAFRNYCNTAGKMVVVMVKGDNEKIMFMEYLFYLKAAMIDASFL